MVAKKAVKKVKREMWKDIDYYLWCVMTGDDEQSRLIDDPKSVTQALFKAGAPYAKLVEADKLIRQMAKGDYHAMDKLEKLFIPYASHQDLLKPLSSGKWYDRYQKKLEYG
jgi:hypothetical protein